MAVALMSWVPARKGWMKKYNGQMYAVSCKQLGCKPTEEASRNAANDWWRSKESFLAGDPVREAAVGELEAMASWHSAQGNQVEAVALRGRATDLATMAPGEVARVDIPSRSLPQAAKAVWSDRLARQAKSVSEMTVAAAWAKWFDSQTVACKGGQFAPSRLESYRSASARFVDWLGRGNGVSVIDGPKLHDYKSHLLGLVAADAVKRTKTAMGRKAKLSAVTADGYLATALQFVFWLGSMEIIDLPRVLTNPAELKKLRHFRKASPKPAPVAVPVVKQLLAGCEGVAEKTKLYLLLMLNCGMYQNDIAELQDSQVDWKRGTITRARSKTPDGVVVTWHLFPETLRLLKKYRSGGEIVLVNEKGLPLLRDSFEGGQYKKVCNITTAYKRLAKRLGKQLGKAPTLKQLRKTSATVLGLHKDYKFYAQYFLGQAPSVAQQTYHEPSEAEFAAACKWLGEQYGV